MFRKLIFSLFLIGMVGSGVSYGDSVKVENPGVWPVMKGARYNPAVKLLVQPTQGKTLKQVNIKFEDIDQVEKVILRNGSPEVKKDEEVTVFGSAEAGKKKELVIKCDAPLEAGTNTFWLDVTPSEESVIGSEVVIQSISLTLDSRKLDPEMEPIAQRIGIMLGYPGEKVAQLKGAPRDCAAFRIPGLIQTKKGTLIGVFDARYENEVDLCRDIDVAVVRSTDGGQTWSRPKVNMDSGPGKANGCGDPCILQDKKGRIWMQALACHFAPGARAINASGKGTDPSKTGQWEMVYSDDEGKTWSRIMNVTEQVKKDEWNLVLAGPGNGICTKAGVIVFPAQVWEHGHKPWSRSSICYSEDGGRKWKMSEPLPVSSSECQVVELEDGSIMLNCRNEARTGKRVVYVTRDLGQTWEPHESNLKTLNDPTCQASLVAVDTKKYGRLLLYSNPWKHGRSNMSIRASRDEGVTWSEGVLYDVRGCMGYSCIAMTDPDHVGIIYETCHRDGEGYYRGIGFIRLPLETIVTGKKVPVLAAAGDDDDTAARGKKKTKKAKKGKKVRRKR